jgi:hypothetical protein
MSESRIGLVAEVATAVAVVTYPIAKVVSAWIERRRLRNAKRYADAAAAVEARLSDRCRQLENRLERVELQIEEAA